MQGRLEQHGSSPADAGWSRDSSSASRRWLRRWFAFSFICATVIGSPLHASSSAPTPQSFRYYMDVSRPRVTLCLGESSVYTAYVYRDATSGPESLTLVDGVKVEAYATDTTVGAFIGKDQKGGVARQYTFPGFDGSRVSADFTFKAGKKPGKTTLVFQGAVTGVDAN